MNICRTPALQCVTILAAGLFLAGCASSPRFASRSSSSAASPRDSSAVRTDEAPKPLKNPTGKILLTLEGVASYYADQYHGRQTSNGEVFDMNALTAAHRTFPFGSMVRVTNLENRKSVVVRVNDRGPFVDGRIIDLSLAAAKELDLIQKGTARVRLEVLAWGDGK